MLTSKTFPLQEEPISMSTTFQATATPVQGIMDYLYVL
jgi:hypothetical protein